MQLYLVVNITTKSGSIGKVNWLSVWIFFLALSTNIKTSNYLYVTLHAHEYVPILLIETTNEKVAAKGINVHVHG